MNRFIRWYPSSDSDGLQIQRNSSVYPACSTVTTDVEKITAKNVTSKDRATLVAADKALAKLNREIAGNLTDDQSVELRAVTRNIENLFNALSEKGDNDLVGWYDMGNGDWGYNNPDGTPTAYKWVASGSNWYFVRDGKMATSVAVDGCWINSLGVYEK